MQINELMDSLANLSERGYIGEPVSQLEHGLQAAGLAVEAGAGEHLILAALLHDVGHWCDPTAVQMEDLGAKEHEKLGAKYLTDNGLHADVARLVASHVDAKRYLAATIPDYLSKLSSASLRTLDHQGGPMSDPEATAFRRGPQFKDALRIRAWDEAAKEVSALRPDLEHYRAMLRRHCVVPLSDEALNHWKQFGWVHLRGWYNEEEMGQILEATDRLQRAPELSGKWMKYFEKSGAGDRSLCRVENFLEYESIYAEVLTGKGTLNLLDLLAAEETVLFKEKINFKLVGGQGFAAHQDAPAFTTFGQHFHITMMLSIDRATVENGCLEVANTPRLQEALDLKDDLTLTDDEIARFDWVPVETAPGDILLFDSYVPHRSAANNGDTSRRALYATYNRALEGDVRDRYFTEKRRVFPPDIEREPGVRYDAGVFNVGNPLKPAG